MQIFLRSSLTFGVCISVFSKNCCILYFVFGIKNKKMQTPSSFALKGLQNALKGLSKGSKYPKNVNSHPTFGICFSVFFSQIFYSVQNFTFGNTEMPKYPIPKVPTFRSHFVEGAVRCRIVGYCETFYLPKMFFFIASYVINVAVSFQKKKFLESLLLNELYTPEVKPLEI